MTGYVAMSTARNGRNYRWCMCCKECSYVVFFISVYFTTTIFLFQCRNVIWWVLYTELKSWQKQKEPHRKTFAYVVYNTVSGCRSSDIFSVWKWEHSLASLFRCFLPCSSTQWYVLPWESPALRECSIVYGSTCGSFVIITATVCTSSITIMLHCIHIPKPHFLYIYKPLPL